ncbi:BQ2448_7100 [Microbotryum intermedium]|uniref:BQ2448_7100 protein n=1 Tax=Microbotryum intermedium TaxID=269621 RepID=A0A238FJ46_9BASI|nr:BQ2448_7100 [Microbotryum intermedium]
MLQDAFVIAWREGQVSKATSTLIGVAICVAGNTCVSLALNVQKLAHTRLQRRHHFHSRRSNPARSLSPSRPHKPDQAQTSTPASSASDTEHTHLIPAPHPPTQLERSISDPQISDVPPNLHLLPRSNLASSVEAGGPPKRPTNSLRKHSSQTIYFNGYGGQNYGTLNETRSNAEHDDDYHDDDADNDESLQHHRTDKEFVKSPLWLLGFALLALGEFGNFLSYSFAPASLVAPLGSVALVANVGLAPLICGEPFRKPDLFGCALAAMGAVTIVWASKAQDKPVSSTMHLGLNGSRRLVLTLLSHLPSQLYPPEMVAAISTPLFIAYSIASVAAIAVLVFLSRSNYGDRYVIIDLGICALSGAFTVLSTKAISSFLNILFLQTFEYWITYPLLIVLAGSVMLQINFINKALQRFESRVVIPIQFTSFALSTIGGSLMLSSMFMVSSLTSDKSFLHAPVGSAVLYREFDGVDLSSFFNFIFGCVICGAGVHLLTRDPPTQDERSTEESQPIPKSNHSSNPSQNLFPSTPLELPRPISLEIPSIEGASSLMSATTTRFGSLGHSPTKTIKQATRKLSLTLGGTQYLLARSPGSAGGGASGDGWRDLDEGEPSQS